MQFHANLTALERLLTTLLGKPRALQHIPTMLHASIFSAL
jgi:hypothetical protein